MTDVELAEPVEPDPCPACGEDHDRIHPDDCPVERDRSRAEPVPFRCLHEAVGHALASLGADVDQVLAALDTAGVPGWPGHPHMDPVCRWLAAAVPDLGVALERERLRVWAGRADIAMVPLPEPVLGAMRAIAAGAAPRLLLDMTPPPLGQLGPHLEEIYPPAPPRVDMRALVAQHREMLPPEPATADPPAARPASQYDTVAIAIPAMPAGARDRGGVLVRVALVCGMGALAAFLLAAAGGAQLAGAALGFGWPVAAILAVRRRGRYPARHRPGHRPTHAAGLRHA